MTKPLLLLSTCGTSIFTNGADEDTRKWLTIIANKCDLDKVDSKRLEDLATERCNRLHNSDARTRRSLSAELNGIGAVRERWSLEPVQHYLVHTDTAPGRAAAEIVEACLVEDGQQVQRLSASGLRTDDIGSFREALADLTRTIEETVSKHRDKGWSAVFNLTGGFKSINAYFQALGMLHADSCVFLFEGAPSLMEIPRLPVRLADVDEVREHLTFFRRLSFGYSVTLNEAAGVPDSLLLIDQDEITTSVWGDVVWSRVRKTLLGEALLSPLASKLTLGSLVQKAFDGLENERKVQVNEALDALSAHLDHGRTLPKANTFKKLQGKPAPPSTHELYLWSDGAAWRLFGHFDGESFVADSLGKHL